MPLAPSSVSGSLLSAGNLSGGPGLTSPGLGANAYMFDNWTGGVFDANDYLTFSTTGNSIAYSSVVFSLYNNYDGTGNWEIRSSVDAYATTLSSGTFSGIFYAGELISADVSALGVQSGTVQFRIYTFNNSGTTNPLQRGIRGTKGVTGETLGQGLSVNGFAAVSQPIGSTTTLNASPNPAFASQLITFSATVSVGQAPEAVGTATTERFTTQQPLASPTGTARFSEGAVTLANNVALSGNVATFAYAGLSAGTHAITATYSGDANYSSSTTSITVNAAPPATLATQAPALGLWGMLLLGACLMAAVWRSRYHASGKSRG